LQQQMLAEGLARVYTFPDNRSCASELLQAEQKARAAARGIWRDPYYAIRKAQNVDALERLEGRYELVEGVVTSASLVRNRLYLNFGSDYRTDFTVTVNDRDIKLFQRTEPWTFIIAQAGSGGRDLSALAGTPLRIRGWLGRFNGPEIVVTHPEQIEFTGTSKGIIQGK
jgi:micrococcal nuclease